MRNARRLRAALLAVVGVAGLSACAEDFGYGGYGYSGVSVGYGVRGGCDPYYYDCGYGYGYGSRYGYADPWYGWWGNYYYPGIGFYIYDSGGRRYRWNDQYRRYWEGRRGAWGQRDWNDPRWQRWDGYRGRQNGTGTWNGQTWQHNGTGTWNGQTWQHNGTGTGHWNGGNWHHGWGHRGH